MPDRVKELHYIIPISSVSSVLQHGILSHNDIRKRKIKYEDISMPEVQNKRDLVVVPQGLRLHDYVNLYFHARNPMMFKRKDDASRICVLQISTDVFHLPNVVITDRNAASDMVRFREPSELESLDFDKIYADDWRHPNNLAAFWDHKSIKGAEVLVPYTLECEHIQGAYVVDGGTMIELIEQGFDVEKISINPQLFFR